MTTPFLNLADFGADGSGMDATIPLTNAIAALGAYGGMIVFPPGDFPISQVVTSTKPVGLIGSGVQTTVIRATTPADNVLIFDYPGCSMQGIRMSSIVPRTGGHYIRMTPSSNNAIISDCYLRYYHGGIKVETGATVHIERTSMRDGVTGAGTYAIHLGGGNDYHINDVSIDNPLGQPEAGIVIDGTLSLQSSGCDIMRAGKALWVKHAYSAFFENTFFDSSETGIFIEAMYPIVRCKFSGCGVSSHSGRGVHMQGPSIIDDIIFSHCDFDFNGQDGLLINGNNVKVVNSSIAGNGGSGIVLGSSLNDSFITGNRIGETEGASGQNVLGIYNLGGYTDTIIEKNNLKGNTWGAWGGAGSLPAGNIT
jgi:hypothetical protein